MDLSALERKISNLENSLSSLEIWLGLMTTLVVIGLVIEYWHEISEAIGDLRKAKKWLWEPVCIILGTILITVGVAGELCVQFLASSKETDLRKANNEVVARLGQTAKDARAEVNSLAKEVTSVGEQARILSTKLTEALRDAAKEQAKRIKLEKQVVWRTLSDTDRQAIAEQIKPYVSSFVGRKIKVSSYFADPEGGVFAAEMADILVRAGIKVDPKQIGAQIVVDELDFGVWITGPSADETFMRVFAVETHKHLDTPIRWRWGPQYAELGVLV